MQRALQDNQTWRALSLYRKILRVGHKWDGPSEDVEYIFDHARQVFAHNRNITDPKVREEKILEAESRIEVAKHYKIPYPKSFHYGTGLGVEKPANLPPYLSSLVEEEKKEPRQYKYADKEEEW
ncbi:Lyrm1 [Acrasis kona]|uniref:Lyrm1 n=1 Tax=Acrasis kona TaxID=1008807 RepID=A0AAW2YJL4_9EUKA